MADDDAPKNKAEKVDEKSAGEKIISGLLQTLLARSQRNHIEDSRGKIENEGNVYHGKRTHFTIIYFFRLSFLPSFSFLGRSGG